MPSTNNAKILESSTLVQITQEIKLDKNEKGCNNHDGWPQGEATVEMKKGYSMKECQKILGVSRCVVDRLIASGELACFRIGEKRKFITYASLDRYLNRQVNEAEEIAEKVRMYGYC